MVKKVKFRPKVNLSDPKAMKEILAYKEYLQAKYGRLYNLDYSCIWVSPKVKGDL